MIVATSDGLEAAIRAQTDVMQELAATQMGYLHGIRTGMQLVAAELTQDADLMDEPEEDLETEEGA